METRPHNEGIESNAEHINWNIKTEAEESAEYLAALGLSNTPSRRPFAYKIPAGAKLNRLSTSNNPRPKEEATQSVERTYEDGLASDDDVYVAYAERREVDDRQDSEDADEGLHLLHEEGRPLRRRRSNDITNRTPTLLRDDAAHPSHVVLTYASPISSEERLLQSTPEPPETDLTAENTEHESPIPPSDKGPRPKVIRFFSRVRITSGVGRSRSPRRANRDTSIPVDPVPQRLSDVPQRSRNGSRSHSVASSLSDSSSISAPLRASSSAPPRIATTRHSNKVGRQAVFKQQRTRASLSQVLDPSSANEWLKTVAAQDRQRHAAKKGRTWDETLSQRREMERRRDQMRGTSALPAWSPIIDDDSEDEEAERAAAEALRKTEADVLYGRWPWRLFNFYVSVPWFLRCYSNSTFSIGNRCVRHCAVVLIPISKTNTKKPQF